MEHKNEHITELTALRLLFMLMIYISHYKIKYDLCGGCGVTAFFMLSGFCMMLGYGEKVLQEGFDYKRFMLRRVVRFYPMHWFCLLFVWALSGFYFRPDLHWFGKFGLNALLLQSWVPDSDVYFSYNSPSWYLCNILFFAALFPFLARWIQRAKQWIRTLLPIGLIAIYLVAVNTIDPSDWNRFLYVQPVVRLVDCILGMYLAMAYRAVRNDERCMQHLEKHIYGLDLVVFGSLAILLYQSVYRPLGDVAYQATFWPTVAVLILSISLRGKLTRKTLSQDLYNNKVVATLGACSFSFYLLHSPVLRLLSTLGVSEYCANSVLRGGGCLFAVFAAAEISYLLIEKKLTPYLEKKVMKI